MHIHIYIYIYIYNYYNTITYYNTIPVVIPSPEDARAVWLSSRVTHVVACVVSYRSIACCMTLWYMLLYYILVDILLWYIMTTKPIHSTIVYYGLCYYSVAWLSSRAPWLSTCS